MLDPLTILTTRSFLTESNRIEGEDWGKLPTEAAAFALAHIGKNIHPGDIIKLHALHEESFTLYHGGKAPIEFGKWRDHDVRVGSWVAPPWKKVPKLIAEYCADWKNMNAWEAHCRFEHIHPFPDLNGRVGRLLWLIKATKEGHDGRLPFLHAFYYQTLKYHEAARDERDRILAIMDSIKYNKKELSVFETTWQILLKRLKSLICEE